jgi:hypothetical protein
MQMIMVFIYVNDLLLQNRYAFFMILLWVLGLRSRTVQVSFLSAYFVCLLRFS